MHSHIETILNHFKSNITTQKMKQLTILFTPIDAVGHVQATSGIGKHLLKRGHRVVFFIEEAYRGKLAAMGFEEYVYKTEYPDQDSTTNPGETMANKLLENKIIGPYPVLDKWNYMIEWFFNSEDAFDLAKQTNNHLKNANAKINPDLFVVDHGYLLPEIYYSGKPWIKVMSTAPLFYLDDESLPPGGSGLPIDDQSDWAPFQAAHKALLYSKKINSFIERLGYKRYPNDLVMPETQLMTVYGYPEELNYPQLRTKGWFNLEVFNKNEYESMENVQLKDNVPEKFLNSNLDGKFSGKLVYLSLGSMGSVDLDLMRKLIGIFAKTNHKYIISKGPRHEELQLGENMWGDRFVKQTKIIPFVDLVITHGGNNTTTETFAQGKPMVVLPMFGDQFDNGQRLKETGYGIRIDPYNFTEDELINGINRLMYDDNLVNNLKKISERIIASNAGERMSEKIETLMNEL